MVWFIGRASQHDWTLSNEKIHMNLTFLEFHEIIENLNFMLGKKGHQEFQESIRFLVENAPRKIRGDLIVVDPDDSDQFIIRIRGRMPDADHCRKVQYRIGRKDAEEILLAMKCEAEFPFEDYDDCEDADVDHACNFEPF